MRVLSAIGISFALAVAAYSADYKVEEKFEWSGEAAKELVVENVNGDITVKAGGDIIAVNVVKKATSEDFLEGIKIEFKETDEKVEIVVDYSSYKILGKKGHNESGRVDLNITIPPNTTLDVVLANGDVTTEGIIRVNIQLANGVVCANGAYENTKIRLANGSLIVNNPDESTNNIEARVANGDIEATFVLPESGGDFAFNAVNGKIIINLEGAGNNFDFEAVVVSGNVTADFPLKSDNVWVGGGYWAKVGDGTNKISAGVVTGTIGVNTRK